MAVFPFTKSIVIAATVIMYYDQSIKPLRDSNRLYYAAITTNHRSVAMRLGKGLILRSRGPCKQRFLTKS